MLMQDVKVNILPGVEFSFIYSYLSLWCGRFVALIWNEIERVTIREE